MISVISKLSQTAKKVPGGPVVQGLVVLAFLALAYFVIRRVIRAIGNLAGNLIDPPVNAEDLVNETPTADGTDLTEEEEDAFALTAQSIAESQYNAMKGAGTNEDALFLSLGDLNGDQLQQVFAKYGRKEGKNLFEWYADELTDNPILSLVYYGEDDTIPDSQLDGCTSYFDFCQEAEFMRAIWRKSGLPITF